MWILTLKVDCAPSQTVKLLFLNTYQIIYILLPNLKAIKRTIFKSIFVGKKINQLIFSVKFVYYILYKS